MTKLIQATDDHLVNFIDIGVPFTLTPEETRSSLLQELPPSSGEVNLTYRVDADKDFWLDSFTCTLWEITSEGQNRTISMVSPLGYDAPVFLDIFSTSEKRYWQHNSIHWANISGTGAKQHWIGVPAYIAAGTQLNVTVQNYHSERTFAISFAMHGRITRVRRNPRTGQPIPPPSEYFEKQRRLKQLEGLQEPVYLSGDQSKNLRQVGVSRMQGIIDQPFVAPSGSFDNPGRVNQSMQLTHRFDMMIRTLRAWTYPTKDPNALGTPITSDVMTWPLFAWIKDERFSYAMSQGPLPFIQHFGWAGQPHKLPVDLCWERQGALSIAIFSMISDQNEVKYSIAAEGWLMNKPEAANRRR